MLGRAGWCGAGQAVQHCWLQDSSNRSRYNGGCRVDGNFVAAAKAEMSESAVAAVGASCLC